jgi:hypothetical protein
MTEALAFDDLVQALHPQWASLPSDPYPAGPRGPGAAGSGVRGGLGGPGTRGAGVRVSHLRGPAADGLGGHGIRFVAGDAWCARFPAHTRPWTGDLCAPGDHARHGRPWATCSHPLGASVHHATRGPGAAGVCAGRRQAGAGTPGGTVSAGHQLRGRSLRSTARVGTLAPPRRHLPLSLQAGVAPDAVRVAGWGRRRGGSPAGHHAPREWAVSQCPHLWVCHPRPLARGRRRVRGQLARISK